MKINVKSNCADLSDFIMDLINKENDDYDVRHQWMKEKWFIILCYNFNWT